MQNYKEINGNDYVKDSRTTINETMQSIQSMNSGTAFPTTNLFEGMKCYRTDLKKTYTLTDATNATWTEDAHSTLADEATHASSSDTSTKLTTARNIGLSGAVTADAATFDGTANATINVKTLDASKLKGTAPVSTTGNAATATKLATARTIALTGNATGSANFDGSGNVSINISVNESKHAVNADTAAACSGNSATANVAKTIGKDGGTSGGMQFHWSGQKGQPTWLWGGNDGTNMYVYDPSNFHVAAANNDGNGANIANTYLKRSGGAMSGALNFANSTWNLVGDDSYMGDNNITGTFCIKGANGETGIALCNKANDADYARISYGGGNINFNKTIGGNISGNSATATKLATARTISLTGKAAGSTSFDGSANASINVTSVNADTASKLATPRKINITGNATGASSFDGSGDTNISVTVNESKHALTADRLGGYPLSSAEVGGRFPYIPKVDEVGAMEVGKYIDWNLLNGVSGKYTCRWTANDNGTVTVGAINGHLIGNADTATKATTADSATKATTADSATKATQDANGVTLSDPQSYMHISMLNGGQDLNDYKTTGTYMVAGNCSNTPEPSKWGVLRVYSMSNSAFGYTIKQEFTVNTTNAHYGRYYSSNTNAWSNWTGADTSITPKTTAAIGQFRELIVNDSHQIKLPDGGTWAYFVYCHVSWANGTPNYQRTKTGAGIAAGGTVLHTDGFINSSTIIKFHLTGTTTANSNDGDNIIVGGFCWRIA